MLRCFKLIGAIAFFNWNFQRFPRWESFFFRFVYGGVEAVNVLTVAPLKLPPEFFFAEEIKQINTRTSFLPLFWFIYGKYCWQMFLNVMPQST